MAGTFRKRGGGFRTLLFLLGLTSLILNLILLLFTRTFWKEVDQTLQNASGLDWSWVVLIITLTTILILNFGLKSLLCVRRLFKEGYAEAGILQVIIVVPVILIWNTMSMVLILEAGDGVIVAQTQYYSELLFPWILLVISFIFLFILLLRQGRTPLSRYIPAVLSVMFLVLAVNSFLSKPEEVDQKILPMGDERFDEQILFNSETDSKYITFRIPGLVITPKGTVIAYCEARESYDDWGNIDLVMKRSLDGGDTWQDLQLLFSSGDNTVNNPVMITESDSEIVHLIYFTDYAKAYYRKSYNGGGNWTMAVEITRVFDGFKNKFPWKTIAAGPGHGLHLKNGRLYVPVWLSLGQGSDGHHPSVVSAIYSDDKGKTWKTGEIVPYKNVKDQSEPVAVELSDGRIMMNMRNNEYSKDYVYRSVSISPDGVSDWTESVLDDNLPDAVCFGSLQRYDENTILFSNVQHYWPTTSTLTFFNIWAPREPIGIRASLDDGRTWQYSRLYQVKEGGYSDINVHNRVIFSLFEQGWRKKNKYRTRYLKLARFNLEWIKSGDKLPSAGIPGALK